METRNQVKEILFRFKKEFFIMVFVLTCLSFLFQEMYMAVYNQDDEITRDFSVVIKEKSSEANKEAVEKLYSLYDDDLFGYYIDRTSQFQGLVPILIFGNVGEKLGLNLERGRVCYTNMKIASLNVNGKTYRIEKLPDGIFSKLGIVNPDTSKLGLFFPEKEDALDFFGQGELKEVGDLLNNTILVNSKEKDKVLEELSQALAGSPWGIRSRLNTGDDSFLKYFLLPYVIVGALAVILSLRLVFINKLSLILREFTVKYSLGKGVHAFKKAIVLFFILSYLASLIVLLAFTRSLAYLRIYGPGFSLAVSLISMATLLLSLRGEKLTLSGDKA